jgi:hypothetical protein
MVGIKFKSFVPTNIVTSKNVIYHTAFYLGVVDLGSELRLPCYKLTLFFVKGKAIPLQAWTGPEGSRRLRLPDFKTVST